MTVKIRLTRKGVKKQPYYHIIVANSKSPRDGKFIEKVGSYNPKLNNEDGKRIIINQERVKYWLNNGAQPTERVAKFLQKLDTLKAI